MLIAGAGLLMAVVPVLAHHSFAAEYDSTKPVNVTGAVTKVEWMNPHARFYLDVKDASGSVTNWEFELGSPNGLMRQGWTRNSMKQGDQISVGEQPPIFAIFSSAMLANKQRCPPWRGSGDA